MLYSSPAELNLGKSITLQSINYNMNYNVKINAKKIIVES